MIKFVCFAAKLQLNLHDLNNEAVAGNVTDIRLMEFLDETGKRVEAPAVSGRMLKHWHYEGMRKLSLSNGELNVALCDGCRIGEPIRPGRLTNNELSQAAIPEEEAIKACAICDIHGYLIAQGAGGERGISARRNSRAMFSWLMPVLNSESAYRQVIHTRVSQQGSISEEQSAQMLFYKSYASGIYGFVSALDTERIGVVEGDSSGIIKQALDRMEKITRVKVAIEAYRQMISGMLGASLSHAVPHCNPIELLVIYSKQGPLPFPVSPIYQDYLEKTTGLVPEGAEVLYWGGLTPARAKKKETINEIFDELIRECNHEGSDS